jgi:hypothetical protein
MMTSIGQGDCRSHKHELVFAMSDLPHTVLSHFQSNNDRMETCRGTLVARRKILARFPSASSRHPRFSLLDQANNSDAANKRRGIDHGPTIYFGHRSVLVPVSQIVLFAVGECHAPSKRETEQNDAIHQVIWAGLRSKQGFVVKRMGSMVTAVSVSLLTLAQMCEAVVRKNENFVTAASQNNDTLQISHNKHTA